MSPKRRWRWREKKGGPRIKPARKMEKMGLVRWRKIGRCRESGFQYGRRVGCLQPSRDLCSFDSSFKGELGIAASWRLRRERAKAVQMQR